MQWLQHPAALILFFGIFFYSTLARLSRWLSIWQQKEYRLDRFRAYLMTQEGRIELKNLVNLPLSKADFKRPRFTPKAILIFATTIVFMLLTPVNTVYDIIAWYLIIPVYILIASIPFWFVTEVATGYYQSKAKSIISAADPTIVGISGSYGKTTTKILVSHLLSQKHKVWHTPKSFNNPLSLPRSIVAGYKKQPFVVIEYAAYRIGEIAKLAKLFPPSVVCFTGINEQHLALFGGYKQMLKAETELLKAADENTPLFFNHADDTVSEIVTNFPHLQPIPSNKEKVTRVSLNSQGQLRFHLFGKKIQTQLIGTHYLINVQQAINIAKHFKVTNNQIIKGLTSFEPSREYIRQKTTKSGVKIIIDDKTSNPSGFSAAIDLLNQIKAKKKCIITSGIVDLGKSESKVHRILGKQLKHNKIHLLHAGLLGKKSFQKELGKNYLSITQLADLKIFMEKVLHKGDVLLIEGKLNPVYEKYLYSL